MDYAVKIIDTLDYSLELKKLFDNNSELLRLGHDNILQTFHYSISLDSNEGNTFQIISLKIQFLLVLHDYISCYYQEKCML